MNYDFSILKIIKYVTLRFLNRLPFKIKPDKVPI